MRISVSASKVDDIIRERDAYNAEAKKQNDTHKYQERKFREAQKLNQDAVANAIRSQVPGLDDVDIRVEEEWWADGGGIKVEFVSEDRSDNKSLRWRWSVALRKNGEIKKESSSWSGLEAVTPEQVADLQKTVNTITNLVNLDWVPILQAGIEGIPDYFDYISVREMRNRDNEFSKALRAASVEELIGKDVWIKSKAQYSESEWFARDTWYLIHSQSDKFYTVSQANDYYVESYQKKIADGEEGAQEDLTHRLESDTQYKSRVKKENFLIHLYEPIQTMDMQGNISTMNTEHSDIENSSDITGSLFGKKKNAPLTYSGHNAKTGEYFNVDSEYNEDVKGKYNKDTGETKWSDQEVQNSTSIVPGLITL